MNRLLLMVLLAYPFLNQAMIKQAHQNPCEGRPLSIAPHFTIFNQPKTQFTPGSPPFVPQHNQARPYTSVRKAIEANDKGQALKLLRSLKTPLSSQEIALILVRALTSYCDLPLTKDESQRIIYTPRNWDVFFTKIDLIKRLSSHSMIIKNKKIDCVESIDFSLQDRTGKTLLHIAAGAGHIQAARYMLASNPELLDIQDNEGNTAADIAYASQSKTQTMNQYQASVDFYQFITNYKNEFHVQEEYIK